MRINRRDQPVYQEAESQAIRIFYPPEMGSVDGAGRIGPPAREVSPLALHASCDIGSGEGGGNRPPPLPASALQRRVAQAPVAAALLDPGEAVE